MKTAFGGGHSALDDNEETELEPTGDVFGLYGVSFAFAHAAEVARSLSAGAALIASLLRIIQNKLKQRVFRPLAPVAPELL